MSGILYFSRVPRDMRPSEIRDYFQTRFGEVFRQKFVADATNTKTAQAIKRRAGKSKALQFREGWLEFTQYRHALEAARQMNSQPVEVKRTRRAAGEMWCVRCLPPSYRWADLVTEVEGEKRLRRLKINAELQHERELNERYRQRAYKVIAKRKRRLEELGMKPEEDDGEIYEDADANDATVSEAAAAGTASVASSSADVAAAKSKRKKSKAARAAEQRQEENDDNNDPDNFGGFRVEHRDVFFQNQDRSDQQVQAAADASPLPTEGRRKQRGEKKFAKKTATAAVAVMDRASTAVAARADRAATAAKSGGKRRGAVI